MKGRGIKVSGKKYYAVRKGRVPGIYESWEEAEKQVKGFPGAEYKSFEKIEYAKAYLEGKDECTCPKLDEETMIAYVDGSYEVVCGSGVVLCYRGKKEEYYFWTDIDEFKDSRNIAGEIMAALF
ncbi:MAG: ribonuclease H-related protein, partial [Thermotoga sp.]|nr:ribonuclease H-related protein [Thermotoga sp.]